MPVGYSLSDWADKINNAIDQARNEAYNLKTRKWYEEDRAENKADKVKADARQAKADKDADLLRKAQADSLFASTIETMRDNKVKKLYGGLLEKAKRKAAKLDTDEAWAEVDSLKEKMDLAMAGEVDGFSERQIIDEAKGSKMFTWLTQYVYENGYSDSEYKPFQKKTVANPLDSKGRSTMGQGLTSGLDFIAAPNQLKTSSLFGKNNSGYQYVTPLGVNDGYPNPGRTKK